MKTSHLSVCGMRYTLTATSLTHAVRKSVNAAICTQASSSKGNINTLDRKWMRYLHSRSDGVASQDVYGLSNVTLLQRCND